jgi:sialate O-acetylesterase
VTFLLKSRITLCVLMELAALPFAITVKAEPRLPHLFSDHMVLQQDREIHVWGWADPGEAIEVRFAGTATRTASS